MATERQIKVLDELVFTLTGKRLSSDYRSLLLERSQGDMTRLIQEARDRVSPRVLSEEVPAPSPQEVLDGRSGAGAWTRATLAGWGVPWPPPQGWRARLEQRYREEQLAKRLALREMN